MAATTTIMTDSVAGPAGADMPDQKAVLKKLGEVLATRQPTLETPNVFTQLTTDVALDHLVILAHLALINPPLAASELAQLEIFLQTQYGTATAQDSKQRAAITTALYYLPTIVRLIKVAKPTTSINPQSLSTIFTSVAPLVYKLARFEFHPQIIEGLLSITIQALLLPESDLNRTSPPIINALWQAFLTLPPETTATDQLKLLNVIQEKLATDGDGGNLQQVTQDLQDKVTAIINSCREIEERRPYLYAFVLKQNKREAIQQHIAEFTQSLLSAGGIGATIIMAEAADQELAVSPAVTPLPVALGATIQLLLAIPTENPELTTQLLRELILHTAITDLTREITQLLETEDQASHQLALQLYQQLTQHWLIKIEPQPEATPTAPCGKVTSDLYASIEKLKHLNQFLATKIAAMPEAWRALNTVLYQHYQCQPSDPIKNLTAYLETLSHAIGNEDLLAMAKLANGTSHELHWQPDVEFWTNVLRTYQASDDPLLQKQGAIIERVLILLTLDIQQRTEKGGRLSPFSHPRVTLYSHGGRVYIQIPAGTNHQLINWLFTGNAGQNYLAHVSTEHSGEAAHRQGQPIYTRQFGTHDVEILIPEETASRAAAPLQIKELKVLVPGVKTTLFSLDLATHPQPNHAQEVTGQNGHFLILYHAPTETNPGCIAVGCEPCAPNKQNRHDNVNHDVRGTASTFSHTGADDRSRKWETLEMAPRITEPKQPLKHDGLYAVLTRDRMVQLITGGTSPLDVATSMRAFLMQAPTYAAAHPLASDECLNRAVAQDWLRMPAKHASLLMTLAQTTLPSQYDIAPSIENLQAKVTTSITTYNATEALAPQAIRTKLQQALGLGTSGSGDRLYAQLSTKNLQEPDQVRTATAEIFAAWVTRAADRLLTILTDPNADIESGRKSAPSMEAAGTSSSAATELHQLNTPLLKPQHFKATALIQQELEALLTEIDQLAANQSLAVDYGEYTQYLAIKTNQPLAQVQHQLSVLILEAVIDQARTKIFAADPTLHNALDTVLTDFGQAAVTQYQAKAQCCGGCSSWTQRNPWAAAGFTSILAALITSVAGNVVLDIKGDDNEAADFSINAATISFLTAGLALLFWAGKVAVTKFKHLQIVNRAVTAGQFWQKKLPQPDLPAQPDFGKGKGKEREGIWEDDIVVAAADAAAGVGNGASALS